MAYERIDAEGLHLVEEGEARVLAVDTVVVCAGQVSERTLADALAALPRAPRVHVIGGADVALELDAERAVRQAVEVVAAL